MFKILAPFVNAGELDALKAAGVDELFCGFVDRESEEKWPIYYSTINRRSRGASFDDFNVFSSAVRKARRLSLPVYLAFNGLYTPEQYPWLLKTIEAASQLAGIHGLIVSDLGLLLELQRLRYAKQIHLSTGATTFNPLTVEFFLSFGIDRVILDRQLTVDEMLQIILPYQREVVFELFIMRSACPFVDGFCTFLHNCGVSRKTGIRQQLTVVHDNKQVTLGCSQVLSALRHRRFEAFSPDGKRLLRRPFSFDMSKSQLRGCNLCALYRLQRCRCLALKVLERSTNTSRLVRVVSEAVRLLRGDALSEDEYKQRARGLFKKAFGIPCGEVNCYCPSALIGQGL